MGALLAGFVQGISGFAMALVATVFWSGTIAPQVAAPLIAICSVAGQAVTIRSVWRSLDLRRAAPMVAGGLAGVPLGVLLLPAVDPATFRLCVGLLLCAYCPAMLALRHLPQVTAGGAWADAAAGALGGVMGGIAGLSGPAPTLWCTLRGWDRDTQRAMFQTFLIVIQAAGVAAYAAAGLLTSEVVRLSAWVLPCILLPSFAGTLLYARLPGDAFRRLVLGLLLLTGVAMVAQALL